VYEIFLELIDIFNCPRVKILLVSVNLKKKVAKSNSNMVENLAYREASITQGEI